MATNCAHTGSGSLSGSPACESFPLSGSIRNGMIVPVRCIIAIRKAPVGSMQSSAESLRRGRMSRPTSVFPSRRIDTEHRNRVVAAVRLVYKSAGRVNHAFGGRHSSLEIRRKARRHGALLKHVPRAASNLSIVQPPGLISFAT